MAQEKKERIFISYKRVDKERVFAIKDGIEQATGEKCWIDLDGIESDAQFVAKIMTAIDQCDVFLFMRSKEHNKIVDLATDWTYRELNYELAKGKNIVFVNLDNSPMPDWVSFMFPHQQEIDATDPEKLARLNKDLCEWLGIGPSLEPDPAELEKAKRDALPNGEFQVGDLMYQASENGNGLTVCGLVNKAAIEIYIPSQIQYGKYTYEVTSIGNYAFSICSKLTSITIPNSVTSIGNGAFAWCEGLTSISIPNSVTSIGEEAFVGCSSLTSITIPNSVTTILEGAFEGCSSLTSITIPNSVTSIGKGAFEGCYDLTSITIPNSVTSIGNRAFEGCYDLTSITIPNSVTSIGMDAFYGCESLTSITIPNSVTSIGERAFNACSSLTSIVVEKGHRKYDSRENCNAIIETASNTLIQGCYSTIIPNSVTSIGDWAFASCPRLTSITIPNSVTSIGDWAFRFCTGLTSITIPNSVTSIGEEAFSYCLSLTSITIPNSVTSIGNGAFSHCSSLASIIIPNSVTSIGERAFDGCSSLKSIKIPRTVTYIGKGAFPEHTQVIRE